MQLDPGLVSDIERKSFINDGLKDVGGIGLFEKLVTLDVVDGLVDLPDDLVSLIELSWNERYLVPMERQRGNDTTDTPIGYIVRYNQVETVPKANGVLNIYYSYRPAMLVEEDDRPDIPNGYDYMLIDYGVSRAHRKNGNIGLAREYMYAYDMKKGELMQELTKRLNSRVTNIINKEYMDNPSTPFDFL